MRFVNNLFVRAGAALMLVIGSTAASSAQPQYIITALFDVPNVSQSWATEINDKGQAVGIAVFPNSQWGWRQDGDTIVVALNGGTLQAPTLSGYMLARYTAGASRTRIVKDGVGQPITNPLAGGTEDHVWGGDVNEAGRATGYLLPTPINPSQPSPFPFIWDNGVTTLLEPGGTDGVAIDLNDGGAVTGGAWVVPGEGPKPVVWADGTRTVLGTGRDGVGIRINNAGQVLVDDYAPFLWDSGVAVDMCPPPATPGCGNVVDLNEAGQAIMRTGGGAISDIDTYRYDGGGVWTNVGEILPTHAMFPAAINDRGDVVGWAATNHGYNDARAFAFVDGVLHDLTALLPAASGWTRLALATDINNLREIVGVGEKDGRAVAFRLTPVP